MFNFNKNKRSAAIAPIVDKVLKLAEQFRITIDANHIPGLSNSIPDSLSRLFRCGNYAIKRDVLMKTFQEFGIQISINIFAIRANRQRTSETFQESQERVSSICRFYSTRLAQSEMLCRKRKDNKIKDLPKWEHLSPISRKETKKQRLGTATWIDSPFLVGERTKKIFSDNCYKLEDQVPTQQTEQFLTGQANGVNTFQGSHCLQDTSRGSINSLRIFQILWNHRTSQRTI
ncbi:MAG: hypothetical protein EZS28_007149 [Streblomastix strix]|uniref:Uncharacterized protein n=1 Tax=Streblomastix strix TaxID=222440 RepID=A0A5J4WQX8_9EUKA|nr:MAG: hypothetical protein EZS28_007149 [Streblomastix strix]